MRLQSISLAWFRGAADSVALELDGKSAVIYGSNGSGKSSFVDAVEYTMTGKIGHLSHEYSGKRQEKALVNTHIPVDLNSEVHIIFVDKSKTILNIDKSGACQKTDSSAGSISSWSPKRTILRQDEVAAFIRDTKGEKYSALLPLLGLGPLEVAADNLRRLGKAIDTQSNRQSLRTELTEVNENRKIQYGTSDDGQILTALVELHDKYGLGPAGVKCGAAICEGLVEEIDRRVKDSRIEHQQFAALNDVAACDLAGSVAAVRAANSTLAGAVEPMILEKLDVLRSAGQFSRGLEGTEQVQCPACGQTVSEDAFKAHVIAERKRLLAMTEAFEARRLAIDKLAQSARTIKGRLNGANTKPWRDSNTSGSLSGYFSYLANLDTQKLVDACTESSLHDLESNLLPLVGAVAEFCVAGSPDAAQLAADKAMVDVGRIVFGSVSKADDLKRADELAALVKALEAIVRDEIRESAKAIITAISTDIQAMWDILHPEKSIENVHLYATNEADKAIDIGLKFYGVPQDSPRLTLSEGYRNSLGLCIFLAMAKRESSTDRPLILDDVVVSLDRNHRGMIVELLETAFSRRQVILLTHDRDWYSEIRSQLDSKNWSFRALLPYEDPTTGIRWSAKTTSFDDARAQLKDRPDSAGNDARKIMDVELAMVAEKLQVRLPYRRGENNDRRTAHDFLERLIIDGKDHFQIQANGKWEPYATAIQTLESADSLLKTWGNKASHTFDVVRPEATKLIDACEAVLDIFRCLSCKKNVSYAKVGGDKVYQCGCGQLRWK
jgi:energy-coupling factor transporter ATP-binding protein EcfA2